MCRWTRRSPARPARCRLRSSWASAAWAAVVEQLEPVDEQIVVLAEATVGRQRFPARGPPPASSVVPSSPMTTRSSWQLIDHYINCDTRLAYSSEMLRLTSYQSSMSVLSLNALDGIQSSCAFGTPARPLARRMRSDRPQHAKEKDSTMANKQLFTRLSPASCFPRRTRNHEGAPAYRAERRSTALAQYAATGCLNRTFYATAEAQLDDGAGAAPPRSTPSSSRKTAICAREARLHEGHAGAALRGAVGQRPGAAGARLPARDRQRQDAAQLRADRALGRGRPEVARLACRSGWCSSGSTRAIDAAILRARSARRPSLADMIKMVHPKPADAGARGAVRLADRQALRRGGAAGDGARSSRRSSATRAARGARRAVPDADRAGAVGRRSGRRSRAARRGR